MTKNPIYNALAALGYIVLVVLAMTYASTLQISADQFVVSIIMLSLLTLSVAVMAYLFGYQPLVLFLDNKKKEAVTLFLKTVGMFGIFALLLVAVYFLFIL